uniref:Uncharacterized protein n=1 Tax=Lactuca sativa TaxID=4236 RepID=A0A9R1VRT9_LACSA|nr:hypothetical protein LSAT_V11C400161630 [Lactuca sativa]
MLPTGSGSRSTRHVTPVYIVPSRTSSLINCFPLSSPASIPTVDKQRLRSFTAIIRPLHPLLSAPTCLALIEFQRAFAESTSPNCIIKDSGIAWYNNPIASDLASLKNDFAKKDFEKLSEIIEKQNRLTIKLTQSIDKHSILLENSLKNNQFVEEVARRANIEGILKETNLKITNIQDRRKKMKEKVSEKLEKYLFNLQYEDYDKPDQKLIKLLSLETEECEELYQKEPQLFDKYFKVAKEDNSNINVVKFEYSDSNEEMEAESSYTATNRGERKKKKNYEFKMLVHNGIPNSGKGPNTINVLNIDCIQDLKLKERVIEKWVTEISPILQTNPDEFGNAKNVLLLLEHKTDGIVQKFLRNNNWNEELHGLDLFDSLINVIYTTFLGLDYVSNKDFTINKKVDIARVSMTKLQLHDICLLDKYHVDMNHIFMIFHREVNIHNGYICLSYENTNHWRNLICQDRYKQQKLKTISKDCCNILSDFKDFDIGRKTYTKKKRKREDFLQENTSKNLLKKHLKRILPTHKERKNADVGSAMKKDTTLMNVQIGKSSLTRSRYYKLLITEAMKLLKKNTMVYNMFSFYMLILIPCHPQKKMNQLLMTQNSLKHTPTFKKEEVNLFFCKPPEK